MENSVKIVFMGTPSFAAIILGALVKNKYSIISVYTRPDKKIGRQQEMQKSVVKEMAEKNNLQIFQPEKFDQETIEKLQAQKPDIIIVAAYGKILPKEVLAVPVFGAINVHPSLLPRFRGPSPVQNTILAGEKETGTTIMLMDEGMDTGDILLQEKISLSSNELYPQALKKMADFSAKLLLKTLPLWLGKEIIPQKQNATAASYCQIIKRDDGKIIWTNSAFSIYNRFRAFYPWPGIFTYWEKEGCLLRLKIHKISLSQKENDDSHQAGEIFTENGKVLAQTRRSAIILEEIQLEGKSKTSAVSFKNGHPNFIGSVLK